MHRFIGVVIVISCIGRSCFAQNAGVDSPRAPLPQTEIRSGGVLDESFQYHRVQPRSMPARTGLISPASGWYGYGFPVETFRWGWFGAEHYYPRVFWHDGYYGDCCRYAYRRGY